SAGQPLQAHGTAFRVQPLLPVPSLAVPSLTPLSQLCQDFWLCRKMGGFSIILPQIPLNFPTHTLLITRFILVNSTSYITRYYERAPHNAEVGGSSPPVATIFSSTYAINCRL